MQSFEFECLKQSIPAKEILEIGLNLNEERLKSFIAFMICKELKGVRLYLPLKAHIKDFSFLLLDLEIKEEDIKKVLKEDLNLDKRTINKILKEYKNEN